MSSFVVTVLSDAVGASFTDVTSTAKSVRTKFPLEARPGPLSGKEESSKTSNRNPVISLLTEPLSAVTV